MFTVVIVLKLSKLKKIAGPNRNRTESFENVLQYLRTLYNVWNLVSSVSLGFKLCAALLVLYNMVEITANNRRFSIYRKRT